MALGACQLFRQAQGFGLPLAPVLLGRLQALPTANQLGAQPFHFLSRREGRKRWRRGVRRSRSDKLGVNGERLVVMTVFDVKYTQEKLT